MARRKKNQIFEEQAADVPVAEIPADEQPASPPPEMYGDMDKECFPSRTEAILEEEQTAKVADLECQLQDAQAKLVQASQRIQQLEDENRSLKVDNDTLLMKLAELASARVEQPAKQPAVTVDPECHDAVTSRKKLPRQKPFSKNVHYKHDIYRNNGYGTWH